MYDTQKGRSMRVAQDNIMHRVPGINREEEKMHNNTDASINVDDKLNDESMPRLIIVVVSMMIAVAESVHYVEDRFHGIGSMEHPFW